MRRIILAPFRWPWPVEPRPVRVEHVRYVKEPKVSPRKTAIDLARQIGRNDLADRLEALGG